MMSFFQCRKIFKRLKLKIVIIRFIKMKSTNQSLQSFKQQWKSDALKCFEKADIPQVEWIEGFSFEHF